MIPAGYFDGKTSRRHPVRLTVHDDGIRIAGEWIRRDLAWREIKVSERGRHGPRIVETRDGARCEVDDTVAFNEALVRHRHKDGWVVRLQQSWTSVLAAVVVCVGLAVATYAWGLPWVAERAAHYVPDSVVEGLSQRALASLDGMGASPSQLPAERRERLTRRLRDLRAPGMARAHLVFRSGDKLGANALALPSGAIIVTDDLIALTADDDDLAAAVFAHELGHVAQRHGLRNVLQATVVGTFATWFLGDASMLLSGAASLGLTMGYSRGFEEDADAYAAHLLREAGLSPTLLAVMLQRLEDRRERAGDDATGMDWLSSHPATAARVARLQAL